MEIVTRCPMGEPIKIDRHKAQWSRWIEIKFIIIRLRSLLVLVISSRRRLILISRRRLHGRFIVS